MEIDSLHGTKTMTSRLKLLSRSLGLSIACALALAGTTVCAAPALPPTTTQNGITTQSGAASDAFIGLRDYFNMPESERSQFNVYYTIRIKHADPSLVHVTLTDGSKTSDVHILADGKISPLPTRDELNRGAFITISGPQEAGIAMKLHVYSTQPPGQDYDAAGLSQGIQQSNGAMNRFAGVLAMALKKLDRVYFVGANGGSVETNGQMHPLPKTDGGNDYPLGTPYFVPSEMGGATHIHLTSPATIALFDTPK